MKGLFVGMSGLDMVFYTDLVPKEDYKGKSEDFRMFAGGPAASAAVTYSLLGGRATLCTFIGNSELGKTLKAILASYGVNVVDLAEKTQKDGAKLSAEKQSAEKQSGEKLRDGKALSGGEAQKDGEYGGEFDSPNVSSITVNEVTGTRTIMSGRRPFYASGDVSEAVFDTLKAETKKADFVLYDCNFCEITKSTLDAIKGKPLVLDVGSNKPGVEECLQACNTAIVSAVYADSVLKNMAGKDDASQNAGRMSGDLQNVASFGGKLQNRASLDGTLQNVASADRAKSLEILCDRFEGKAVVITQGEKEMLCGADGEKFSLMPPKVKAVDTLGAGDVFHGAYCFFRYHKENSMADALNSAAKVAAESVKCKGPVEGVENFRNNM